MPTHGSVVSRWVKMIGLTGRSVSASSVAVIGVCPLPFAKLRDRPARCTRRVFQVGSSLVRPVQGMSRIGGAYCNDLVVGDEYVGPKSEVGECSFYGFRIEYAGLQPHVVFDDQSVASAVESVVRGESSAVLRS